MQDRYTGDVGDFGKYGLLRALTQASGLRLGVVWYLVPDESHTNDGRHISYLQPDNAPRFRPCDTDLYDALRKLVNSGERRVTRIRELELLPPQTTFYERLLSFADLPIQDRPAHRKAWLERALLETAGCDLVLLAPDNGLEVASVDRYSPKGPKYALYDDLAAFWRQGQSLVVYQHISRAENAKGQVLRRVTEIRSRLEGAGEIAVLRYRRGTSRVFLALAQPRHRRVLNERIADFMRGSWSRHFDRVHAEPDSPAGLG